MLTLLLRFIKAACLCIFIIVMSAYELFSIYLLLASKESVVNN